MDNVRTPSDPGLSSSFSSSNIQSDRSSPKQIAGPDASMIVDGFEPYNDQENEVVNISPGPETNGDEPEETKVRADDCKW
jgi:hypothetical protein